MIVFKEGETKKSWSLELEEGNYSTGTYSRIVAVDSITGKRIAPMFYFSPEGSINTSKNFYNSLVEKGYEPREHGNGFLADGSVRINTGGIF